MGIGRPAEVACSTCGETWPFDGAHFFVKAKNCRWGLSRVCKACYRAYQQDWRKKNKPRLRERRKELYEASERVAIARRIRRQWLTDPAHMRAKVLRAGMRDRSKKLELPWDRDILTVPYLTAWLHRQSACECCGREFCLQPDGRSKSDSSPSIDRIRPERGYVLGNVALLCWRCNNLKRAATAEELEQVAAWIRRKTEVT